MTILDTNWEMIKLNFIEYLVYSLTNSGLKDTKILENLSKIFLNPVPQEEYQNVQVHVGITLKLVKELTPHQQNKIELIRNANGPLTKQ